jgi:hypothetical protein
MAFRGVGEWVRRLGSATEFRAQLGGRCARSRRRDRAGSAADARAYCAMKSYSGSSIAFVQGPERAQTVTESIVWPGIDELRHGGELVRRVHGSADSRQTGR